MPDGRLRRHSIWECTASKDVRHAYQPLAEGIAALNDSLMSGTESMAGSRGPTPPGSATICELSLLGELNKARS